MKILKEVSDRSIIFISINKFHNVNLIFFWHSLLSIFAKKKEGKISLRLKISIFGCLKFTGKYSCVINFYVRKKRYGLSKFYISIFKRIWQNQPSPSNRLSQSTYVSSKYNLITSYAYFRQMYWGLAKGRYIYFLHYFMIIFRYHNLFLKKKW